MAFSMTAPMSFAAKASFTGRGVRAPTSAAPVLPARAPLTVQAAFLKKKAAPAPAAVAPAQSFTLTVPGALFQARNNIKIPVELGFTVRNPVQSSDGLPSESGQLSDSCGCSLVLALEVDPAADERGTPQRSAVGGCYVR